MSYKVTKTKKSALQTRVGGSSAPRSLVQILAQPRAALFNDVTF